MRPETSKSKRGYVYVLQSARCDCIKIGGTDYPPLKRIKEINATEPYKSFGKWIKAHNGTIRTESYATAVTSTTFCAAAPLPRERRAPSARASAAAA